MAVGMTLQPILEEESIQQKGLLAKYSYIRTALMNAT